MSNDLISRKAVLARLKELGWLDLEKDDMGIKLEGIVKMQPTAYDVYKVVEQLRKSSHNYYPSVDSYCFSEKAIKLKDAIEIVKAGE